MIKCYTGAHDISREESQQKYVEEREKNLYFV